jgi:hypothetical protein
MLTIALPLLSHIETSSPALCDVLVYALITYCPDELDGSSIIPLAPTAIRVPPFMRQSPSWSIALSPPFDGPFTTTYPPSITIELFESIPSPFALMLIVPPFICI